ncbi:HD domain-containing protein [Robertkochia marina]|uniref:HD domain-containing protein n=1 Tax=Robertkochia marina TaxID=1227945 RepID=A0A4S3M417_9FLAO|nr:HD domain-containing protein [Robertkochia marina]THD69429.1 HD domain-containing protein [Robertkochia marina]TRZ47309.1 HD domain-containing protein [Robertkochia marina]
MSNSEIIEKTIAFVKEALTNAEGGHDWFHTQRVFKSALFIAKDEKKANPLIVGLGALLHDIADSKFHEGDETVGPEMASGFLHELGVEEEVIQHVVKIIENISFKGGNFAQKFRSVELDIIQDADRLDALGAIGIARTFNYGGFKNRPLYDPDIPPRLNMSKEEYKNHKAPTINHFYEKLLLLKDRMNTKTGVKLAEERHRFMEDFLEQFYAEWEGKR